MMKPSSPLSPSLHNLPALIAVALVMASSVSAFTPSWPVAPFVEKMMHQIVSSPFQQQTTSRNYSTPCPKRGRTPPQWYRHINRVGKRFMMTPNNSNNNKNYNTSYNAFQRKDQQQQQQPSWNRYPFHNNRNTNNKNSRRLQTVTQLSATIPTLDNWYINIRGGVTGVVVGHPDKNISDGELLTTSTLSTTKTDCRDGSVVVTISGSKYKLGSKKGNPNKRLARMEKIKPEGSVTIGPFTFRGGPPSNPPKNKPAMKESPAVVAKSTPATKVTAVKKNGVTDPNKKKKSNNIFSFNKPKKQPSTPIPTKTPATASSTTATPATTKRQQKLSTTAAANKNAIKKQALNFERQRELKLEYGLTGKSVGGGKYLLCGKPQRSTSGKSQIWPAYRADENGLPTGKELTIKVSPNLEAITRENKNYNSVTSGLFQGRFVDKLQFLQEADGVPNKEFRSQCALVIESGRRDLKALLAERKGRGLEGRAMRDAASSAALCIQAMHSSGIVWTDLKAENFVVVTDDIGDEGGLTGVKGIDLESAMPHRSNPVDFSPEACPPEFAKAFIAGEAEYFILDYTYDVWSFGMMLYELSTGSSYFGKMNPAQITKNLQYDTFKVDISAVEDNLLRDLIQNCLQTSPRKRPSINSVLLHPYFITSGIGPFGFSFLEKKESEESN